MCFGGEWDARCRGVCVKRLNCLPAARTLGRLAQAPLQRTLPSMPNRPPRLDRVFQRYDPPLYFVTFNAHKRQKLLANAHVHPALIRFAHEGEVRGIGLGRYVIMPDHIHAFVRGDINFALRQWVRMGESYAEKWEYVRQNPVRAGLVRDPDEWPWQGEVVRLEARSL